MKVVADTNVLVRIIMQDNEAQAKTAANLLRDAELITVGLPCLCEVVWVLSRTYKLSGERIAVAIRALLNTANIVTNRPAAEAGLAVLDAGGDFADGVIAYEGYSLGGKTFVSFDKKAVSLLTEQGQAARLLA